MGKENYFEKIVFYPLYSTGYIIYKSKISI